ncbi:hypothetical protein SAMN05216169_102242 [Anoxybacillus pushchinoensis]|uniref:FunZ protein n=1 Tax=Anoxybacillus pushchinoensis TaxID=150248 RepID=A0A1I0TDQ1_9BACL|nr:hypothetical protein F510_0582 [Anoxybacillus gonensis]SFA49922.1 hypothetical protein SAMN05216169_102242 [Anoxybacillus pushchinoensis]
MLVSKVPLKKLFIGNIDGETESQREDFEQLFYTKNSKFDNIMQPEKFIISGRKGTGKTILAKYIYKKITEKKNHYCKIFTKNDFKLQKLIDMQFRELQEEELSIFWKWTFLLQISNVLLDEDTWKKKIPFTPERKLMKFIKNRYPEDIFKIKDFNKSISSKSSANAGVKSKSKLSPNFSVMKEDNTQTNTNYIHKEYFELLPRLERLVLSCLKSKKEVILIYDDLDELEERINEHRFYYRVLISMLETIKQLNLLFKDIQKSSTKIIVLLRSDIIDQIHQYSSNSNKLITESRVNLYWIVKNYKSPSDHPLMEMILNKIQKSVENYSSMDKDTLYKLLFPKKINNKEVIDYLLDYSFGRPRDIIRYLNLIIDNYPEATSFKPKYFKECAQEYSNWFYNELENEISISENKEMILDGLRLINDIKKLNFTLQQIEEYFKQNGEHYPKINNLNETLRHLYKLGVIGNSWVYKRNGEKTTYRYSWGYREDASNDPNFSQWFSVHYGLKKRFSL